MGHHLPEELVWLDLQSFAKREYGIDRRLLFATLNLEKVFSLKSRKVRKCRLAHPTLKAEFFEHSGNRFGQIWILSHMLKVSNTVDLI